MNLASLSSQLLTIKDWVAVATGILGAILGVAGFVLGLMGYIRSRRVDRRTYLEPYFQSIWPKLSNPLREHIERTDELLQNLRRSLRSDYNQWRGRDFRRWPEAPDRFGLNKFNWSYDRSLRKKISIYLRRCEKLEALVSEFNKLVFLITDEATTWAIAVRVGGLFRGTDVSASEDQDSQDPELERFKADLRSIAEKYVGGAENIPLLRQNKRYRFSLWRLKWRVRLRINAVERAQTKLTTILDFHEQRFSGKRNP